MIAARGNAAVLEPFGHPPCILNGERVNNAVTGQARQEMSQPSKAIGLVVKFDVVEPQRRANQRAAQHVKIGDLRLNIAHDPIIGGSGRAKHRHVQGQQSQHPDDAAVIRTKIVAPVRDAVGFVHDKHADAALNHRQQCFKKFCIAQPFRRNHEHVHLIVFEGALDSPPIFDVLTVNGRGTDG